MTAQADLFFAAVNLGCADPEGNRFQLATFQPE
jgi:hypothetical protein